MMHKLLGSRPLQDDESEGINYNIPYNERENIEIESIISDTPMEPINTSKIPVKVVTTRDGQLDTSYLVKTEGWIYKKGGTVNARGGFKSWRKRWFVLAEVDFRGSIGYELQYYDTMAKTSLKGTVGLSEVEIFCAARSKHRRVKYEFQILLQNGSILELSCDDADEREGWIETLNMVISYLRRLATASGGAVDGYDPMYEDDEQVHERGKEIADNSSAFGPGLYGAEVGQKANFYIQLRNSKGEPLTQGGMPLTITVMSKDCLYYLKVNDMNNGKYGAHYTLSSPGFYELHMRINDEHEIFGSPVEFEVLPTRTAPHFSIAEGLALSTVSTSNINTFTITAKDSYGNTKKRGGDPFEIGIMGPGQVKSLKDNEDGTYTCQFEAQHPKQVAYFAGASLTILITLNGHHIYGSPFKPTILDDAFVPQIAAKSSRITEEEMRFYKNQRSMQSAATSSVQPPPPATPTTIAEPSEPAAYDNDLNSADKSIENKNDVIETPQELNTNTSPDSTGVPMSRLERARHRALLAKSLTAGNAGGGAVVEATSQPTAQNSRRTAVSHRSTYNYSNIQTPTNNDNYNYNFKNDNNGSNNNGNSNSSSNNNNDVTTISDASDITKKLSKLEMLSKSVGASTLNKTGSKLSLLESRQQLMSKLPTNISTSLDINSVVSDLKAAMIGVCPPTLGAEEKDMWQMTDASLRNQEVIRLLSNNLSALKHAYDCFAEADGGNSNVQSLKLTGSTYGGAFRLLEEYNVIPPYMSKRDAKIAYMIIMCSQRNAGSQLTGLDFSNYIKLLVLVAVVSLSKTSSFSSMYASMESRVDVMLTKWGFADVMKLNYVKNNIL